MARVFIIFVTIIVGTIIGITACNYKEQRSPYSKEKAVEDIESGNVKLYSLGLSILYRIPSRQLDSLQIRYGFIDVNLGCFQNDSLEKAIKEYNDIVNNYLTKRNGAGWEKRYHEDVFRMAGIKKTVIPKSTGDLH